MKRIPLCAIALLLAAAPAAAQTGTVTGNVTDTTTGASLQGAQVQVVGANVGGITNSNGRYVVTGVPPGTYSIRVIMLGYADQTKDGVTVASGQTAVVDFSLETTALALGGLTVRVGYASELQRNLSGSISTVNSDQLNPVATTSVNQMLRGQATGLRMTTRSAQPGGAVSVNIRGAISPRGNNTPLYVIDGVPMTQYSSTVPGLQDADLGFYGGIDRDPLSFLNPADIQSVTVLKDASAAAIYGSAAANGVVLITTKAGTVGNLSFHYRGSYTAESPHKYFPLLNAHQFMEQQSRLAYDRYLYDNKIAPYGTTDPSTVAAYVPLFTQADIASAGPGTNWLGLVTRDGGIQEHEISLSGGNLTTHAYASFDFRRENGLLRNSSLNKYAGRINLDQTITNAVQLSIRAGFTRQGGNNASSGSNAGGGEKFNMLQAAYQYAPNIPVRESDGSYTYSYYRVIMNPAAFLTIQDNSTTNTLFFTPNVTIDFTDKLRANVVGQVNQESTDRGFYLPRATNNANLPDGMAQKSLASVDNYSGEGYLTYTDHFGESDLSVVAGAGYYKAGTEGHALQAVNFFTDAFGYNNVSVASDPLRSRLSSYKTERTKISQFGQVNYSLRDRYILSLVARRDGSSIFSKNHKYGIFPGASAAWIISDEPFFQGFAPSVSQLKLRVGYGEAGNESILSGNTLQLYSPGYPFLIGTTLENGVALSQVANPNLTWEKMYTFNAGLDFGLWNQRLTGSVDYFVKTARDLLDFNPLPSNNAVGRVADNVGATRSKGVEVSLHGSDVLIGPLRWSSDVNVTHYHGYWLERNPQVPLAPYIGAQDDIDAIYGWQTDGIIQSDADRPSYMPDAYLGNMRYVDQNGDGQLDESDVVILGHSSPRWTVGFNNTFRAFNFDLNVFMYGNLGFKRGNTYAPSVATIAQPTSPGNTTVSVEDAWSADNPTGTYPGIASNPYSSNNPAGNDFNLKDASFLRLQNVTVGYTLPTAWLQGMGLASRARLFLDFQDLGLITSYPGFDPEYTEANPYPKAFRTTLGLDLSF